MLSGSFIMAWLPYSILSLWTMFNGGESMSETFAILAPLLAKSAVVWNPMIYAAKNSEFRSAVISMMSHLFSGSQPRQPRHAQSDARC